MNISDVIKNNKSVIKVFGGVSAAEIEKAENELGVRFAHEYKEYLAEFGTVMLEKVDLFGLNSSARLDVVKNTLRVRESIKLSSDVYCIESLGIEGYVTVQKTNGELYIVDEKGNERFFMSSLAEYVRLKSE